MRKLFTGYFNFGPRDKIALSVSLVLGIIGGVLFTAYIGFYAISLLLPLLVLCIGEHRRYTLSIVTVTAVQLSGYSSIFLRWLLNRETGGYSVLPISWPEMGTLFLFWAAPVGVWTFISWLSYQDGAKGYRR